MSLETLDAKIIGYREAAATRITAFREFITAVNADTTLTLVGKNQKLEGSKEEAQADVTALQEREKAAIAAELQSLERAIGGTVGTSGANVISFRDAQDRAARADGPTDALSGIRAAITTDDRELARAYLMRAVTERDADPLALALGGGGEGDQWAEVVQAYINAYPTTAQAVSDLYTLRRRERNRQYTFSSAGAYVVL